MGPASVRLGRSILPKVRRLDSRRTSMARVQIAIAALLGLLIATPARAGLNITPTTTLAAETSNNTSAASTFTTQTNGNNAPANISKISTHSALYKGATTPIYAHFMPWFGGSNHMSVGYGSDDPAQVHKQVDDIMSRGMQGVIIDWYGPTDTRGNNTSLYMMHEAETRAGQFAFAIMEDGGALKTCAGTAGCDVTQRLLGDLNYISSTYEVSPAYMRVNGRPVIPFFSVSTYAIDWNLVRSSVPGNPLFIFRNNGAYTTLQTNGGFSWVGISSSSTDMGLAYLDSFYSASLKYPADYTFGSSYKGFNDTLAAWGKNRIVNQQCGQTWLTTLAEAAKYYGAAVQLDAIQMVTWNDYEEGTEIETGIDNCISISASLAGTTLGWSITGQENTVDHYTAFVSTDGQNLMPVADVVAGTHELNLASLGFSPGTYVLYVKAVGRPGLQNHVSAALNYTQSPSGSVTVASPLGNSTVSCTVPIQGSAASANPISSMQVYVDSNLTYQQAGSTLNTTLTVAPGTRAIVVKAWDSSGANFSSQVNVKVVDQPPQPHLAATVTGTFSVTASTAGSIDPDGTIASSSINFGDGTVVQVAPGASATHSYKYLKNYNVTATAIDNWGASSTATTSVNLGSQCTLMNSGVQNAGIEDVPKFQRRHGSRRNQSRRRRLQYTCAAPVLAPILSY